jgi:hypothetical protein
MRSSKSDPIVREWQKLFGRIRRHGVNATSDYVIGLIKTGQYPLYYSKRFTEYLLKHDKYIIAGKVLRAIEEAGIEHSLIDELKSSLLWGIGKHNAAISHAVKSANRWLAPFLYYQVSEFYSMKGQNKKSDYYFEIAHSLAKQEEKILKQKS